MTQTLYNKKDWTPGPWNEEPDLAVWVDADAYYPCVAKRGLFGAWCGYVGLFPSHPLYGSSRFDPAFEFIEVHNHVNMSNTSANLSLLATPALCHWWVGFSCTALGDFLPISPDKKLTPHNVYRTFEYVQGQIDSLAAQLAVIDTSLTYESPIF